MGMKNLIVVIGTKTYCINVVRAQSNQLYLSQNFVCSDKKYVTNLPTSSTNSLQLYFKVFFSIYKKTDL